MTTSNIADLRQKTHLSVNQAGGTKTLAHFFNANKNALASLLPKHVTPERMMRLALNAVRTTQGLAECTIESIYGGVVLCAQLGVEPNTPLGHAYLIPFKNRKKGTSEAQFILGYKGMLALARQSGEISGIDVQAVYTNDHFEYEMGLDQKLSFRKADGARGDFRGCYICIRYKDGSSWFDWMSAHDIYARRERSQGYRTAVKYGKKDNPWMTDFEAMAKKTVVRAAMPWLPISTEKLAAGVAYDAAGERGDSQHLEAVLSNEGDFTVIPAAVMNAAQALDHSDDEGEGEGGDGPEADPAPSQATSGQQSQGPRVEELGPDDYPIRRQGKWIDINGEVFSEASHAWSRKDNRPVCNQDGSFRARRGTAQDDDVQPQDGPPEPPPVDDDEIPSFGGLE